MVKLTAAEKERRESHRMVVALQIRDNTIKTFADIFAGKRFPKTYVVQDIGISNGRISHLILNPDDLTLGDCKALGKYFDVPAATIALLGFNQSPTKMKNPQ